MGEDLTNDVSGVVEAEVIGSSIYQRFYIRRPTLRIMVYTDSSRENFEPGSDYGFSTMVRLVAENNPFYVNIQFTNVNRHEGGVSGARKLTDDAVNPFQYDEIWFFCRGQRNIPPSTRTGEIGWYNGNFLDSELTNDEVELLWSYMSDRGVLIAGDHANPDPVNPGGPPLNLGRAVGYRIPRAGKLRRWEGAPGPYEDRYNTVMSGSEADGTPQRISLTRYPRSTSVIDFSDVSHPHPIFCGRNGPIEILPDHMHEGHITIPARFDDEEEWPRVNGIQPRPEVIARGINHRDMSPIDLVAAYDGAVAGVGRIVADSTWHHYQNYNLNGIARDGGIHARTLGNFYANLAVWLAPSGKRELMQQRFFWRLSTHPYMVEFGRQSPYAVGRAALDVLGNEVSVCDIYQMFHFGSGLMLMANELPPMELCLGNIVNAYHEQLFFPGAKIYDKPTHLIRSALGKSLEEHIAVTNSYVEQLKRVHKELNLEKEDGQPQQDGWQQLSSQEKGD